MRGIFPGNPPAAVPLMTRTPKDLEERPLPDDVRGHSLCERAHPDAGAIRGSFTPRRSAIAQVSPFSVGRASHRPRDPAAGGRAPVLPRPILSVPCADMAPGPLPTASTPRAPVHGPLVGPWRASSALRRQRRQRNPLRIFPAAVRQSSASSASSAVQCSYQVLLTAEVAEVAEES